MQKQHTRKPNSCKPCPLYSVGVGFIPGNIGGNPIWAIEKTGDLVRKAMKKVRMVFVGEGPALDELVKGIPFIGKAGQILRRWVGNGAGVDFDDVLIDNTLRCVQPNNEMPKIAVLREAQAFCSQYDRYKEVDVELDMLTYHPAAVLRDPVPLPLLVHDVGVARKLSEQGKRVRVLLGKSTFIKWYPYAASVSRWRGHRAEVG